MEIDLQEIEETRENILKRVLTTQKKVLFLENEKKI
jgi:hypothetical protein